VLARAIALVVLALSTDTRFAVATPTNGAQTFTNEHRSSAVDRQPR
jgi:hypothetical protein